MQTLTFALNGETFAVPIDTIKEIIEYPTVTQVPLTPPVIRGLMNLRGEVIPVIDLAERFALGAARVAQRVIIFEVPNQGRPMTLGAVVDTVHEVIDVTDAQIDPPPEFGSRVAQEFIRGMLRHNDQIVTLLDLPTVLSPEQLEGLLATPSVRA